LPPSTVGPPTIPMPGLLLYTRISCFFNVCFLRVAQSV
jgi:hypothetical protein